MRVSATAHKPCRVRELHGVRMCQWLGTEVESGWIGRRLMGVCVVSMQGAGVRDGWRRSCDGTVTSTRGFNLPNKAHARFSSTVRTVLLAALTAGEASLPPCAT